MLYICKQTEMTDGLLTFKRMKKEASFSELRYMRLVK